MDWVIFGAAVATTYLLWDRATNKLIRDGRGWLFRNWVAGVISGTAAVFQTILLIGDFGVATLFGWLLFGFVVLLSRLPLPDSAGKPESSVAIPYKMSPVAEAAYQNSTPSDDPLSTWKKSSPKKSAKCGLVADIEFDYRDARGKESYRHISVEAVNHEYFQGYCHAAHDTRTFVIGRVRGLVLDLESGELIAPKAWAAESRKNPLNDPDLICIGGDSEDDYEESAITDAASIEICFTGFTKADKLRLEGMAYLSDMRVRQSVTKGLTHLCAGKTAGPKKIEQATEVGAELIDEAEFYSLHAKD